MNKEERETLIAGQRAAFVDNEARLAALPTGMEHCSERRQLNDALMRARHVLHLLTR